MAIESAFIVRVPKQTHQPREATERDKLRLQLIGGLLAVARKDLRLSSREVAERAGISGTHVLRMESGEYDFSLIKFLRVCEVLGLPPGILTEGAIHNAEPRHELAPRVEKKLYGYLVGLDLKDAELKAARQICSRLVCELSEAVVSILRSSNPHDLSYHFLHDYDPLTERFQERVAEMTAMLGNHKTRLANIEATLADPFGQLLALGMLDADLVRGFVEWAKARKPADLTLRCAWIDSVSFPDD